MLKLKRGRYIKNVWCTTTSYVECNDSTTFDHMVYYGLNYIFVSSMNFCECELIETTAIIVSPNNDVIHYDFKLYQFLF